MAATTSIPLDYYNIGRVDGGGVAWEAGANTVAIVPTMTIADAENTANSAYMAIEGSNDDQKTWFPVSSYTWEGGTNPPALGGGPSYPSMSAGFSPAPPPPAFVRVVMSPNQPISIGIGLEFSST